MNKACTEQLHTEYILDDTVGLLSIPPQRKKLFELAVVPNVIFFCLEIYIIIIYYLGQTYVKTPHRLNFDHFQEVFESYCV